MMAIDKRLIAEQLQTGLASTERGDFMAYLESIPLGERKMMMELDCSGFEGRRPWVATKPLHERRIALLSTAALNLRSDAVYQRNATDYRVIPGDVDPRDVVMSHASVNFDRTGFQQDLNICFPIQRLHELARDGVIGSVADFHFTVSGAPHPADLATSARHIARMRKADAVDTVLLVPI
jgi:D-proline reductase (dithiol) PrdB